MTLSRRTIGWVVSASALAIGCSCVIVLLHADTAVRCTAAGPNQLVCRVDEPNVKQRLTDYRQVAFQPGDRITITAGGCAQTGGRGATWKRYVNPSGSNANREYWGTVSIPGATAGIVRLSEVVGRQLTVPAGIATSDLYLRLGYIDDDYGDNGYWNHDDGTENQCKSIGNAFVSMTIDRAPAIPVTCAGTTGTKPLDMVWTDCDPNGFPLNARWRYQVDHNGLTPPAPHFLCPAGVDSCSSWPLTRDSGFWCGPHVNYFAVTYQGMVDWDSKSTAGTDDDYNYRMFPPHEEGVLTHDDSTLNGIETEFDSDETIDYFTSPLWGAFHKLVDQNNASAQAAIKGKMGVITGLMGLDCGHPSCSSELHPAYALAVNSNDLNLSDDQWTMFARNWGDEGYCSSDQHNLPVSSLKVQIPWLAGATAVTIGPDTQFYVFTNSGSNTTVQSPQLTIAQGQGVMVEFSLPGPAEQIGLEGELHLQWTVSQPVGLRVLTSRRALSAAAHRSNKLETDKPELMMDDLISKINPAQAAAFRSRIGAAAASGTAVLRTKLALRPVAHVASFPKPPRLARPLAAQTSPNRVRVQKSESLRAGLCDAYKNSVPGNASLCTANPRPH